jgi:hypothetical protein
MHLQYGQSAYDFAEEMNEYDLLSERGMKQALVMSNEMNSVIVYCSYMKVFILLCTDRCYE